MALDPNIAVLASLKNAGLFLPTEKTSDIARECKNLTDADKEWLIGRMEKECPQLIVRRA